MTFFPTPVLVGVDETPESRHALLTAAEISRSTGSALHLAHVKLTSGMIRGRPMTPEQRSRSENEGDALLDESRRVAVDAGAEPVEVHLRYAENTEEGLVLLQRELVAGLLVIGENPRGGLAHRLFRERGGPSAVRRSPGSVMVVRPPGDGLAADGGKAT